MKLPYLIVLAFAVLVLGALAGCGGAGTENPDLNFDQGPVDLGPLDADAAILADEAKGTSATFNKFFFDSVNAQSTGRWTVENNSGFKSWSLSNTANTPPKSWILGGNYWNREDDVLTSNQFTIPSVGPDPRTGIALSFYSRWSIGSQDIGRVQYQYNGNDWTTLATFTGGSNPGYPNWTKYYFPLPDGLDTNAQIRFTFTSDTSGNDWGFGVDNVSVYQTNLNPPASVTASDFLPGGLIIVSWANNDAGTLAPDVYDVYRGDTTGGPYSLRGSVNYPGVSFNDTGTFPNMYFYVVKARKEGYDDSINSNEDSGSAGP